MPMKISEFKTGVINRIREKFEVKERMGGHVYYEVWHQGKKIKETHHSHGRKEISDRVLGAIKRQLNLNTTQQLDDLKNCSMSAEDYLDLLKQKHVIGD